MTHEHDTELHISIILRVEDSNDESAKKKKTSTVFVAQNNFHSTTMNSVSCVHPCMYVSVAIAHNLNTFKSLCEMH